MNLLNRRDIEDGGGMAFLFVFALFVYGAIYRVCNDQGLALFLTLPVSLVVWHAWNRIGDWLDTCPWQRDTPEELARRAEREAERRARLDAEHREFLAVYNAGKKKPKKKTSQPS